MAHAGAGSTVAVGVAAHDAVSGARVAVWPLDNAIHELSAPAAITAAAGIVTAAASEVATAVIGRWQPCTRESKAASGAFLSAAWTRPAHPGPIRNRGSRPPPRGDLLLHAESMSIQQAE